MNPYALEALFEAFLIGLVWASSPERAPPGTSSLTFVFDTTGSMNDDLIQVQDGARKILDTVLRQREKLIYNYVYVPFHDPRVGPVFATTDSNAFQRHLNSVHVVGGGDCPEMTLSGIQLALETALPSSFIYVFTDARSKDYHLEDQILNLIQEKQSSVVFVMTGDCNDRTHPGFRTYEKIAAASFGQVFHLEKTDVNKVLNYVRHSVAIKKVHIMYEVRERGGTNLRLIPVDQHLNELTLSLSGDKDDGDFLDVSLVDPKGNKVERMRYSNESGTIDLNNIKLIRITEPMPGIWRVRTSSRLKHTLRILGHGAIDFKYGFSARPVDKIELAHQRPVSHQSTYLLVNMTGLTPPGTAVEIALVDYYGKELLSKPASINKHNPYLYYMGPFVPPKGLFFVRVKGEDDKSYEFQRIAPTAISSVQAGGPRAYMADRTTAFATQSVNLTCSVASRSEFTLYWFKGREQIGGPLFYPYSDTAVWTLNEVTPQDRGEYRCVVTSENGNHTASTFLETREPAPEITSSRNVSVPVGMTAFLHCLTQSAHPTIQWMRGSNIIGNTDNTRLYPNGTLRISSTSRQDAGAYRCRVQTTGGTTEATIFLKILEMPKASIYPTSLFFVRGQSFNISCYVTGDPKPEPQWYFKGNLIIPDHRKYYITYKYDLIVHRPTESDAGVYECRASNQAGYHVDSAIAQMAIPPKVRVTRDRQMIGRGDRVVLECQVLAGNPKPKVIWYRGGREVPSYRYIQIDGGRLTIQGVQDSDAGSYTCVAQNIAGRDFGNINLDVGSLPTIVPTPETIRVNIERSITLQCRAIGHPIPKITWHRHGIPIAKMGSRVKILPDGSLLINNAQTDDQDRYTCTAKNIFGQQDKTTMLMVTGLISPVLGHVPPEEQLVEGKDLRLSCVVVLGTPKPTLKWFKDGLPLQPSDTVIIEGGGSGVLLRRGNPRDEGRYTCAAISPAGNATLNVNVQLIRKPIIEDTGVQDFVVSLGESIDIPCKVSGKPPPKITWSLDGKPLAAIGHEYTVLADNTLRIHRANNNHIGKYVCTASNAAGESEHAASLNVLSAPIIAPGQISYNLIQGNSITLPCEVKGEPQPKITWYLNEEIFTEGIVNQDGSLTIPSADELHRGHFKCVAENEVGIDERIVILTVHTAPTIEGSGQVKTIVVNVNETAVLPCPARAQPPPTRAWSYEGDRLYPGYTHGSEIRFTSDGSIEVVTPQMNHAGKYTCHVSNLAGDDHITYLLKVQEPPVIISEIPGTIDVVLGLMLEIPCRAIGSPDPTVTWEKDGFQIIPDDIVEIDPSGTLRIEKTQLAHRGEYRCLAANPAGKDLRNTLVVVQEPPVILPTTLSDYTTVEGDRIELRCFAKANPPPVITWSRKGVPITDETIGMHVTDDGTLIIDSVENDDAGHYTCKASNAAGDTDKIIRLSVIIPPDIPDPHTIITETVVAGQPFSLYCPVFSTPLPQITWHLDDRPIAEGDPNIHLSDDKRRLHILRSRTTDAGSYKCVARNPAGESSKTFHVEVLVPPNLDESTHKLKLSVLENGRIEIGCPVSGIPSPDISWLANGQLLEEGRGKRGVILAPGGLSVLIESAQLYHEGIYTCVAANKAGSLDIDVQLTVLAPPKVGDDEELEVTVGKGVTLNCDVEQEGLQSTITWLANGSETLPANAQVVLHGRRLYVDETTLDNQGDYQCRVRNNAGESNKNFKLTVIAPPQFRDKEYTDNLQVTTGTALTLTCYVNGSPEPSVRWLRDGRVIVEGTATLSDDDQKLIVQHSASGNHRYACLAANKAGTISREFSIQVIAPPEIDESGDRTVVEVLEGHSVTLECPVSAPISVVDIDWLKQGRPLTPDDVNTQISLDRTRLVLMNVQKDHEATFTCVAKNSAGQAAREFQLIVLVPPRIIGKMVEDVVVIEGESLELECDFDADPIPEIFWTKDGAVVEQRVQLLNEKRTALVSSAGEQDAGNYRCTVRNKAGQAEKTFNVRVILKPQLIGSNETTAVEVLITHPVTFECPIVSPIGVELMWTKDEIPIVSGTENVQLLNGGRHLLISSVAPRDEAIYTCVARNQAGQARKNFKLSVLVPPSIIGIGGEHKVIENNSLVLPCEVEGYPLPRISWTKDGKPALSLPLVQALSGGQQFKIVSANRQHRGSYMCTALNKVGKAEINFDVDVITRPTVAQGVKAIVEVIKNESAVFRCPITDMKFVGEITWLKDFEPIDVRSHKYALSHSNRKLHLLHSELRDEGSYSCRVKNDAGESRVDYKLVVLVPPEIIMLDKDKNRTAIENSTVLLSCPATGKPEPTIDWYKDGELLTARNITRRIRSGRLEGNDLRIARIQVSDSGRFTCEAKNKAGMAEQDVLIYVMTPPRIEREGVPSEIGGKSRSTVTISCPAYGRPPPTVTWLKAGRPLDYSPEVYLSANGMKLHFLDLKKTHADRYTCIARNLAGEDKRDFVLKLLEAPTIEGPNILRKVQVNAGRTSIINCPVMGSPEPSIAWLKNGQPMVADSRHVFLNGGRQLQISDTSLQDDARYTCIATNNIGLADLETYLQVIGSPVIAGDKLESVEVVVNEPRDLDCEVSGTEPMDIEWQRGGQTIDFGGIRGGSSYMQVSARGRRLHILSAQVADTGRFTCLARNSAGEARKSYDLKVVVPPTINESTSSLPLQTIIPGTAFAVECKVDAIPDAQVTWKLNERPVVSDDTVVLLNNNQTLWVNRASDQFGGRYTCDARNKVGHATRDFLVKLTAPPLLDRGSQELDVVVGDYIVLTCKVISGTGNLSVKWLVDGKPVHNGPISPTVLVNDRRIEIRNARLSDSGNYVCIVENEAGQARKKFDLAVLERPRFLDTTNVSPSIIVGRPLVLDCSVTGTPKPTVVWLKNGKRINDTDLLFLNDRQQLHIESATEEDAGRYSCVAENKPGRVEKDLIVAVLKPPKMEDFQRAFEVPENETHTLICPINDPSVGIQWLKNGVPLTTSNNIQLSTSGHKLHIMRGQVSDGGRYTCRAWNDAGEDTSNMDVIILVPPKISGPPFRTIDAILNQTVQMECKTSATPPPEIVWSFDGKTIFPSEKTQILNNGTVLRILGVQANQEGRYSCTSTNKVGRAEADTFLQVTAPPRIITPSDELKVIAGQGQTIRCEVSGTPPPRVEWLKNGKKFDAAMTQTSSNLHYIHLREAQVEDAGRYTCIATNRAGEHRMSTELHVLVPPQILEGERVVQVKENTTLTLDCQASGNPTPKIIWKRDGIPIESAHGPRLVITSPMASDAGRFTCEARNEAGKASADFEVDVFIKPRFRDLKSDVRVKNGERTRLECKVDGHPAPIITWLRGGRPIEDMKNLILSPRGETLMILKAKRADAGSYSCVAKNFAGESEASFMVTVLTKPHIGEQIDQNPRVVQNHDIVLHCPARGNPKPTIYWLFNGAYVQGNRYSTVGDGDLKISSAQENDAGRYTCFAQNEAGSLSTDYELEVIGPPRFHREGDAVYEVKVDDSITMDCAVDAEPRPEIIWYRGDSPLYLSENIHISSDGQQITIRGAQVTDGGKYTCKAKNEAGSADIDLTLKVLVPPTIDKSNIIGNPLAIAGRSIYLECPVTGIPQPTVTWYKEGNPIDLSDERILLDQNNQTFGILHVEVVDQGRYYCVAENKGGKSEQEFNLEVLVPPQMETTEVQKFTRREDDSLTLWCPVRHVPDSTAATEIFWYKDGRPIDSSGTQNVKLSSDGRRLQLMRTTLGDAGNYSCIALNRAGESSLDFDVEILSAPKVDGSRNDAHPHVAVGRPITLWCITSGHPFPTIRWLKDGKVETGNTDNAVRILENGQALEIINARPEHGGIWTCEAENDAGKTELEFNVDVWTPPTVRIDSDETIKAIDTPITLHCHASGNPQPSLSWSMGGQPLISSAEGARISLKGTRLDIPRLQQSHVGEYTCSARNEAGSAEASVHVDVLVPPVISRDNVEMSPRLPTGQTLTLLCDASGKPFPDLDWYINNTVVRESSGNVVLGEDGRYMQWDENIIGEAAFEINVQLNANMKGRLTKHLGVDDFFVNLIEELEYRYGSYLSMGNNDMEISQNVKINNISLMDRGVYRCVANNVAGRDELLYTVAIVQAPTIANGGTQQVIEGEVAKINCNAYGEPPPVVTWQRNGVRVETGVRYIAEETVLKVIETRSSDSGIYVCVATNEAGTAQQAFTLEVLVAPRIVTTSPNESVVPVNDPFSLKCGVRGYPFPEIIWTIDEKPVEEELRGGFSIAEDGTLFIEKAKERAVHTFKCTARNDAGIDEKEYVVKAISPPFITKEGLKTINSTEGDPSLLVCEVEGHVPQIYWYKDGVPLTLTPNTELSEDSTQLKIHSSKLHDEGLYSCVAMNPAGNATQKQQLYVGVPPRITEKPRRIIVKSGQPAELWCEAVGIPQPQITWLKDDVALPQTALDDHSETLKSTAIFANVSSADAGVYTCKADNWAGTSYKDVDLVVLIPPQIYPEMINLTANLEETLVLPCNATGIPEPVVSWVKMPNIDILGSEDKYQILGTSLAIRNIGPEDDGFYHCIAKSNAGQAIGARRLNVIVPKKDYKVIWVECDDLGNPVKTTYVPARGDVPEDEDNLLPWKQDYQDLPTNGTNGILIRCLPGVREPRRVPLTTAPHFAYTPRTQTIRKGSKIDLHCSAYGPPTPEIFWMKNGEMLIHERSIEGHSTLRIDATDNSAAGTYVCIAQNIVGTSRTQARIIVEDNGPQISETRKPVQHVAVLTCFENGVPQNEFVTWTIHGEPVNKEDDKLHVMNNGSLVIFDVNNVAPIDLHSYQCFVRNRAQSSDIEFTNVVDSVPKVVVHQNKIYTRPGDDVIVDCHLQSDPLTTKVQWTKNNVPLAIDERVTVLSNNSLHIKRLRLSDRASYKCRAFNRHGKSWDGLDIIVQDGPGAVVGFIDGVVNSAPITNQALYMNVTPETNDNSVFIKIDNLVENYDAVTSAMIGYMSAACEELAYDPGRRTKHVKTGKFEKLTDYRFETGEKMHVKQYGRGLEGSYLQMDVLFDGEVPKSRHHNSISVDDTEEEMVEEAPGLIRGHGHSALRLGKHTRIPFHWNHSISYDASKGMSIGPGKTLKMKVKSEHLIGNRGYKMAAKARRKSKCPQGYEKVNGFCEDINECALDSTICGEEAVCVNSDGGFSCSRECPLGFKAKWDGTCMDIDECTLGIHNCTHGSLCTNTKGGFKCETKCLDGYFRNENGECEDVDECVSSPCEEPLECLNQIGSYICLCPSGFPMDEDERCQVTSAEEDSPPKTLRFNEGEEHGCPPGYTWNGRICEDIDECAFESPCQFECRNTPGGYQCECPEGYELEDGDCIDIDECADEPCTDDELCFNKLGSFECIATPCPPGYHLDISQCVANCANCSLAPIRIHMLSVPSDIKPGTSMLRLTAYDSQSRVLHRTRFHLKPSTKFFRRAPFALKNEGGRAVLQNMKALMPNSNHRLAIRSISKSPFTNVKYHSDFIVFISVSDHPF